MQTFYAVLFILYIYISPAFNKRAGFTYESHATHSRGLVHHEFIPETDQNSPDTLRSYVNRLHGEPVKISYCELDAEMRIGCRDAHSYLQWCEPSLRVHSRY